jgi:hypothetical protein
MPASAAGVVDAVEAADHQVDAEGELVVHVAAAAEQHGEAEQAVEEAARDGDIEGVDAAVCVQMPLLASAEAAQGWLAAHPAGRAVPVREAWDLSPFRDWRDRMPALLNLGH